MSKYELDLCDGSILKKTFAFAVPLICSNLLQLLFNAADSVIIGHFCGDESLAAVGVNASLINLMTNLFIGLSVGCNVLVGKYIGAKQKKDLFETVHTAILLSIYSGIFLSVAGFVTAPGILRLMHTPPEIMDLATTYIRIYFLGMLACMVYNFGSAILRSVGDTRRPLCYLVVSGVVNVLLNLFSVVILKLDVAGVAIATVISQTVAMVLTVRCLMREESDIHLDLKKLHIYKNQMTEILRIGIPAGVQGIVFSVANLMIQSYINGFGAVIVAANSVAGSILGFVYAAMNAFYHTVLAFISQNMGAHRYRRISRIVLTELVCVIVIGTILGNAAVLWGEQLLSIFTKSPDVIRYGVSKLRISCSLYALCGMMEVMAGTIRGLGYSVMPMITSLVGGCVFRIFWIMTVCQVPEFHTPEGIYWSFPFSWLFTFLVHVICFLYLIRHLKKQSHISIWSFETREV